MTDLSSPLSSPPEQAPPAPVAQSDAPPFDHEAILRRFLNPAFLRETIGHEQQTVLMRAARDGDAELLRFVLPDSDALAPDRDHFLALHFAAQNGRAECVRLLLETSPAEQCAARARVGHGFCDAMDLAMRGGHWDCVRFLAPHSNLPARLLRSISDRGLIPLQEAARAGRADMLAFLAPFCEPAALGENESQNESLSALHHRSATKNFNDLCHSSVLLKIVSGSRAPGALDCARFILSQPGAQARRPDDSPFPSGGALFSAISMKNAPIAAFLAPFFGLELRQTPPKTSEDGPSGLFTPVGWALSERSIDCLEALLPLCGPSLATQDCQSGSSASAPLIALFVALEERGAPAAKEVDWRMADAVCARVVELGCSIEPLARSHAFLREATPVDANWERLPRLRAQIEAAALRGALSEAPDSRLGSAQSPLEAPGAAEPDPRLPAHRAAARL